MAHGAAAEDIEPPHQAAAASRLAHAVENLRKRVPVYARRRHHGDQSADEHQADGEQNAFAQIGDAKRIGEGGKHGVSSEKNSGFGIENSEVYSRMVPNLIPEF